MTFVFNLEVHLLFTFIYWQYLHVHVCHTLNSDTSLFLSIGTCIYINCKHILIHIRYTEISPPWRNLSFKQLFYCLLSTCSLWPHCIYHAKKEGMFEMQLVLTTLVFFLIFQLLQYIGCTFFLNRSNCCAGYMLETQKRTCVGKYQLYFNKTHFMK